MKNNLQKCLNSIDQSLDNEFDWMSGISPIKVLNLLSNTKYKLRPKQRIVVSPNVKEDLIAWVVSDALSSNCASLEKYMNGEASEPEMLKYAQELIRDIEYESDKEKLSERVKLAKWSLQEKELIIKEL